MAAALAPIDHRTRTRRRKDSPWRRSAPRQPGHAPECRARAHAQATHAARHTARTRTRRGFRRQLRHLPADMEHDDDPAWSHRTLPPLHHARCGPKRRLSHTAMARSRSQAHTHTTLKRFGLSRHTGAQTAKRRRTRRARRPGVRPGASPSDTVHPSEWNSRSFDSARPRLLSAPNLDPTVSQLGHLSPKQPWIRRKSHQSRNLLTK